MTPLEELAVLLRPAGGGLYLVSTGREEQELLQRRLYGATSAAEVDGKFRDALARDKTRTQVFDISELGLVEMTRKRIGEGLLESFSHLCPNCDGRGVVFDVELLPNE